MGSWLSFKKGRSMRALSVRLTACFALVCMMIGLALAQQTARGTTVRQIYVEPFTTQAGSEKFRDEVIRALGNLHDVSLTRDKASADAVLGGGGSVWIKGYRSHNPQLGSVPANGSPIYNGFLSVELRDKEDQTLWSYLATPPEASGDVAKDLATQIVNKLASALNQIEVGSSAAPLSEPTTLLKGAGATFPFPVYTKWFSNYRRLDPTLQITYAAVGSEQGIRELMAGRVDFGASDSPDAVHDLAAGDESKYLFFSSVVGAVVPIVNLPGLPGDIAFTPEALAGIYLGKITKWNDPVLTRINHGMHLPDLDITVVHRADGSGTSYVWTDYLSKTSPEWKSQVGTSIDPKWPAGIAGPGNDGVAALVKEHAGSIGYVEFIYALQNQMSYGRVRNQAGKFVSASLESISAAVSHYGKAPRNFKESLVDMPGEGVYPIISFTWIVVPAHIPDEARRNALVGFLKWMVGPGQRQAAALGYLPLPAELSKKEQDAIRQID
jgi:phosphate transport system substrate-binding protein